MMSELDAYRPPPYFESLSDETKFSVPTPKAPDPSRDEGRKQIAEMRKKWRQTSRTAGATNAFYRPEPERFPAAFDRCPGRCRHGPNSEGRVYPENPGDADPDPKSRDSRGKKPGRGGTGGLQPGCRTWMPFSSSTHRFHRRADDRRWTHEGKGFHSHEISVSRRHGSQGGGGERVGESRRRNPGDRPPGCLDRCSQDLLEPCSTSESLERSRPKPWNSFAVSSRWQTPVTGREIPVFRMSSRSPSKARSWRRILSPLTERTPQPGIEFAGYPGFTPQHSPRSACGSGAGWKPAAAQPALRPCPGRGGRSSCAYGNSRKDGADAGTGRKP